jgi:hypothetical protein
MNRRVFLLLLYFVGIIAWGASAARSSETAALAPDPSGPESRQELCEALGRRIREEPLCSYESYTQLRELLQSVFPIGQATRADVRARLGLYLIQSQPTGHGNYDVYAVQQGLFIEGSRLAVDFTFDKQDVLLSISVIDSY